MGFTSPMADNPDSPQPSKGLPYVLGGVVILFIGAMVLVNTDEEPDLFFPAGMALTGIAAYLILVGAVARGVQIARR